MADEVILIIEDDLHIGGLVAQVLREAGYRPELVRDVHAARAAAERGLAPAGVLSDLMVSGSAGPALLAGQLGLLFPSAPITLMTGVPPKRRLALGVTHDRVIEKPFELETLLESVAAMLAAGPVLRSPP
jgi:DNA-binding response OmpR family regulator